jgi:hypothetical protein
VTSRRKFLFPAACAALLLSSVESGCSGNGGCACSWFAGKTTVERVATDVEMLGDGSEPRVTLRVARWSGLRYRSNLVAAGSIGLEGAPPLLGPTTSMVVDSEVLRGSADPLVENQHGGEVRLIEERSVLRSMSISQQGVPQQILDFWNQVLLPLRGTSYLQHVAESAEIVQLSSEMLGGVQPPEAVSKAVDQALEEQRHAPFRLPPVPVGVGAKWRFHENLLMNGAHVTQTAEMTLKAVDANQAVVDISLHQEAPRQPVPHPLQPGSNAVLEHFRGDGGGELIVDRLTAIVTQGSIIVTARSTLSAEVDGKKNVVTLVGASTIQMTAAMLSDEDSGAVR